MLVVTMPWSSGEEFASKHNHSLKGEGASKAASIANAILRDGGDEGIAIATANKYAKKHRADGGHTDYALRVARDAGGYTPPAVLSTGERLAARELLKPYGFTAGIGGGRTDKNDVTVGSGAYVLPADVVAGLGDGNSLAGAHVWNEILSSMPYGVTPPKASGRMPWPSPPHDPYLMQGITGTGRADGGEADGVPIRSADGEIIVSPEDVMRFGKHYAPTRYHASPRALLRRGHKVLDGFVKRVRGHTIRHLKDLRGPVGSENPSKGHI